MRFTYSVNYIILIFMDHLWIFHDIINQCLYYLFRIYYNNYSQVLSTQLRWKIIVTVLFMIIWIFLISSESFLQPPAVIWFLCSVNYTILNFVDLICLLFLQPNALMLCVLFLLDFYWSAPSAVLQPNAVVLRILYIILIVFLMWYFTACLKLWRSSPFPVQGTPWRPTF